MRRFMVVLAVVGMAGLIGQGCITVSPEVKTSPSGNVKSPHRKALNSPDLFFPPGYTANGIQIAWDDLEQNTDKLLEGMGFSGTATNLSGKDLVNVKLSFEIYDGKDKKRASPYAFAKRFRDGGVWKFTVKVKIPKGIKAIDIRPGTISYSVVGNEK